MNLLTLCESCMCGRSVTDRLGNEPCAAGGSGGQGAPVRDNHGRHTWKAEGVEELWQIGWVTGPARLVAAVGKAHQFVTTTVDIHGKLRVWKNCGRSAG